MAIPRYAYKLAAGYNNAAGLVNIESITPSGDKAFYPPQGVGAYDPGQFRIRGDGTVYVSGFAATEWLFSKITRAQVRYLQTTYCNSGWSGKVTVATKTDNINTYANFNAVMVLTKLPESQRNFTIYRDYVVRFTRMEAI